MEQWDVSRKSLDQTDWDGVIIGAGVAGSVAAAILARRGWSVLLLEKMAWPRSKVCGGCLNALAVRRLQELGLGGTLANSQPLNCAEWHVANRSLRLSMPGGAAVLRREFDESLVAEAIGRGVTFCAGCRVTVLGNTSDARRQVGIQAGSQEITVNAKVVLAADGLGGTSLSGEPWAKWRAARAAWIGVSATLEDRVGELPLGVIQMHLGAGGYAGLVRLPGRRVHLAAALDPRAMRQAGSPGALIELILRSTSLEKEMKLPALRFGGTPPLTRRRERLGDYRVLVIGDACGYVEPFTGQGMAWAIESAIQVAEVLPASVDRWPNDLPQRWQ
ncbi:MAG: FAD-dependent monooxygenase, partial [Tepidisphaeraceae bacterium]